MIWIAIKGASKPFLSTGDPVFYAKTEADLIEAILRLGFVPTEWSGLFESDSEWIQIESIPSVEEEEQ